MTSTLENSEVWFPCAHHQTPQRAHSRRSLFQAAYPRLDPAELRPTKCAPGATVEREWWITSDRGEARRKRMGLLPLSDEFWEHLEQIEATWLYTSPTGEIKFFTPFDPVRL